MDNVILCIVSLSMVRWHGSLLFSGGSQRRNPGVGPICGPVTDGHKGQVQLGLFGQLRTAQV